MTVDPAPIGGPSWETAPEITIGYKSRTTSVSAGNSAWWTFTAATDGKLAWSIEESVGSYWGYIWTGDTYETRSEWASGTDGWFNVTAGMTFHVQVECFADSQVIFQITGVNYGEWIQAADYDDSSTWGFGASGEYRQATSTVEYPGDWTDYAEAQAQGNALSMPSYSLISPTGAQQPEANILVRSSSGSGSPEHSVRLQGQYRPAGFTSALGSQSWNPPSGPGSLGYEKAASSAVWVGNTRASLQLRFLRADAIYPVESPVTPGSCPVYISDSPSAGSGTLLETVDVGATPHNDFWETAQIPVSASGTIWVNVGPMVKGGDWDLVKRDVNPDNGPNNTFLAIAYLKANLKRTDSFRPPQYRYFYADAALAPPTLTPPPMFIGGDQRGNRVRFYGGRNY